MSSTPPVHAPRWCRLERGISLEIDLRVYPLDVLKRALYRMARMCQGSLERVSDSSVRVILLFSQDPSDNLADECVLRLHQEILDEDLRAKIREQTAAMRTLILAAAFSRTRILPE